MCDSSQAKVLKQLPHFDADIFKLGMTPRCLVGDAFTRVIAILGRTGRFRRWAVRQRGGLPIVPTSPSTSPSLVRTLIACPVLEGWTAMTGGTAVPAEIQVER